MFRPLIRLAKKGRLKKYKADGEFPLHRRQDYYEIPPTAGAAPSKPSVIRDLDDPTLDDSPPKQRRLKPHEIYPREEKRTSLNPGLAEHPTKVSADTSAELQIPEVDIVEAAKKFHWMPHPKTRPKGDEYFAKYFLARDRRLDGREKEFKKILDELPDEAKEANKRISPRKYWYSADYETPKAEDVPHMKSCEVKKVMMEEAHQVRKKQAPFNEELWTALAQRGAEVACGRLLSGESGPQCGALTTLRMLQALASVQVSVNAAIMQIVDRVTNEKRLKPQHHHFFLQALSRLRLRDARVFGVVEKMSLVWGVLPLKQLVRVSNAVAKLDLGSGVWARPLKDVLASQLPNLGARIQRLKSVAVVELLDEPERYLVEAFNQREHIRYSRHLQLVELFVRLRREEQWAAAGEEVKEWLEEIRDESYVVTGDDKPAEPSTLAASIASALRKGQSDWSFEEGQRVGPYFSDLWLFKKKILVEALCPYSFYVRTRHITSTARMRLQFLEMMGFQVKTIAYYDWPSDDRDAQTQFLQKMLNG